VEKLILERTSPVQGEPVKVNVSGSRGHCGEFIVTFEEWIHFNKLIKEGQDSLKRKKEQRIEVEIRGRGNGSKVERKVEKEKAKGVRKEVSDEEVMEVLGR